MDAQMGTSDNLFRRSIHAADFANSTQVEAKHYPFIYWKKTVLVRWVVHKLV